MVIGKVRVHETDISWCGLEIRRRNKMCSNTVIALLSIFVILSILFAGFYICYKADIENISILNSIKNFVIDLFKGRNILGKFLSSVIFLLSIPGMLFVILLAIVEVFVKLFIKIWKLGNK
jgi:hypothetical protein